MDQKRKGKVKREESVTRGDGDRPSAKRPRKDLLGPSASAWNKAPLPAKHLAPFGRPLQSHPSPRPKQQKPRVGHQAQPIQRSRQGHALRLSSRRPVRPSAPTRPAAGTLRDAPQPAKEVDGNKIKLKPDVEGSFTFRGKTRIVDENKSSGGSNPPLSVKDELAPAATQTAVPESKVCPSSVPEVEAPGLSEDVRQRCASSSAPPDGSVACAAQQQVVPSAATPLEEVQAQLAATRLEDSGHSKEHDQKGSALSEDRAAAKEKALAAKARRKEAEERVGALETQRRAAEGRAAALEVQRTAAEGRAAALGGQSRAAEGRAAAPVPPVAVTASTIRRMEAEKRVAALDARQLEAGRRTEALDARRLEAERRTAVREARQLEIERRSAVREARSLEVARRAAVLEGRQVAAQGRVGTPKKDPEESSLQ